MNIEISKEAEIALEVLKSNGFEGYIVGGCVRDSLMNIPPHDFDICTNALPEKMSELFHNFKVVETGLKHGTITVIINGIPIEITTYRFDGEYSDNRHPTKVSFVSDLKSDLSRRDFTVNAMAFNAQNGLQDFFGGQKDIKNKLIKCVGEPDLRFNEDALRMLRALRFSSVLGFEIDEDTSESILKNKGLLKNISSERISAELNKLLLGDNVYNVLEKYRGVIAVFIPELEATFDFDQKNPHHSLTVYNHIIKSVESTPKKLILRLTMLLHDIGKPKCFTVDEKGVGHFKGHQKVSAEMSEVILKRLKYDSATIKRVTSLIFEHDNRYPANKSAVKSFMSKYDYDFFKLQNKVRRADCSAQSMYLRTEKLRQIEAVEKIGKIILEENECFSLDNLKINGDDLISSGFKEGKQIGEILNKLLELVISDEVKNDRQSLINRAKAFK